MINFILPYIMENRKCKTVTSLIPVYLVIDFSKADNDAIASNEDVLSISKRLIEKNKDAYEVLAK